MLNTLFSNNGSKPTEKHNVLLLKLDSTTAKLKSKVLQGIVINDTTYLIPNLEMEIEFVFIEIEGSTYQVALLCDKTNTLNIMVTYKHSNILFSGDGKSRLELYKKIVASALKLCIYKGTYIYNESQSEDLGVEVNHLIKLYELYSK